MTLDADYPIGRLIQALNINKAKAGFFRRHTTFYGNRRKGLQQEIHVNLAIGHPKPFQLGYLSGAEAFGEVVNGAISQPVLPGRALKAFQALAETSQANHALPLLSRALGRSIDSFSDAVMEQVATEVREGRLDSGLLASLAFLLNNHWDRSFTSHGLPYLTAFAAGAVECVDFVRSEIAGFGLPPAEALEETFISLRALRVDLGLISDALDKLEEQAGKADGTGELRKNLERSTTEIDSILALTDPANESIQADVQVMRDATNEALGLWKQYQNDEGIDEPFGAFIFRVSKRIYELTELREAASAITPLVQKRFEALRQMRDGAKALSTRIRRWQPAQRAIPITSRKTTLEKGLDQLIAHIDTELATLKAFSLHGHLTALEERMALPAAVEPPLAVNTCWGRAQVWDTEVAPNVVDFFLNGVSEAHRERINSLPEISLLTLDGDAMGLITRKKLMELEEGHVPNFIMLKIILSFHSLTQHDREKFPPDWTAELAQEYYQALRPWMKDPFNQVNVTRFLKVRSKVLKHFFESPGTIAAIRERIEMGLDINVPEKNRAWFAERVKATMKKKRIPRTPAFDGEEFGEGLNLYDFLANFTDTLFEATSEMDYDALTAMELLLGIIPFSDFDEDVKATPTFVRSKKTTKKADLLLSKGEKPASAWRDIWGNVVCVATPTRTYFVPNIQEGKKVIDMVERFKKDEKRRESSFIDVITGENVKLDKGQYGYSVRKWDEIEDLPRGALWYNELREKMLLLANRSSRALDAAISIGQKASLNPWVWRELLGVVMQTEADTDKLHEAIADWILSRERIFFNHTPIRSLLDRLYKESFAPEPKTETTSQTSPSTS